MARSECSDAEVVRLTLLLLAAGTQSLGGIRLGLPSVIRALRP